MPTQKRTASQAHLPYSASKLSRIAMSTEDAEQPVAHTSQPRTLLSKWRDLTIETAQYIFRGAPKEPLPLHASNSSKLAQYSSSSSYTGNNSPRFPLKQTPKHRNCDVPTNLLATSSKGTAYLPRPPPATSSSSSSSFSRLSPSRTGTDRSSVVIGKGTFAFPTESPQRDAVRRTISRSLLSDVSASGIVKNYKTRNHIYARQHRKSVTDALTRKLYELEITKGYKSDFETFRGYLEYRQRLERENKLEGRLHRKLQRSEGSIITSADKLYFERAVEKAKRSLESPKPPKPFNPSFDQLRRSQKAKDEIIHDRLHPKRKPLPERLNNDAQREVNAMLQERGIVSKAGREQVSDQDLRRLLPGQWLNDEIINFYGQLILNRSMDVDAAKENKANGRGNILDVHYFSTFFWPKLLSGYEKGRLAKWTKKLDIFAKDVVLIPVNHSNSHWTAAAINFRRKRIESYDSMNLGRNNVYTILRSYLDDEHKNKKKRPFDFTEWEDHEAMDYPQQENGYDCGVFTCQTLEALSRGEEEFNFSQQNMPYLRQRMIWEIGRAKLADPLS